MRAAVRAAWPALCERFEGRLSWMYLDTKGLVTTGTGNLIDSIGAAQALPWFVGDRRATLAEVEQEWRRVKALTRLKHQSGWAYQKSARLHLDGSTIDDLLQDKTAEFWTQLARAVPNLDAFPADAQLALLDLAWQNGPAFLRTWNDTRRAVLDGDFAKTADVLAAALKPGDRTTVRVRLFRNAARVTALHLDPDVLWDTRTPSAPASPSTTPKGPLLMSATAKQVYQRANLADQTFGPGEHTLTINNGADGKPGDASLVVGPNDAVDINVGAVISSTSGGVLRLVLVDYVKGSPSTIHHRRIGQSFAAGERVEVIASYSGSIGAAPEPGHTLRLRVAVESDGPVTVHDVQSSGYTL